MYLKLRPHTLDSYFIYQDWKLEYKTVRAFQTKILNNRELTNDAMVKLLMIIKEQFYKYQNLSFLNLTKNKRQNTRKTAAKKHIFLSLMRFLLSYQKSLSVFQKKICQKQSIVNFWVQ